MSLNLHFLISNPIKEWGEYGDPTRVTAIARVIEFLRQSESLCFRTAVDTMCFSSATMALLGIDVYQDELTDTLLGDLFLSGHVMLSHPAPTLSHLQKP